MTVKTVCTCGEFILIGKPTISYTREVMNHQLKDHKNEPGKYKMTTVKI